MRESLSEIFDKTGSIVAISVVLMCLIRSGDTDAPSAGAEHSVPTRPRTSSSHIITDCTGAGVTGSVHSAH